MKYLLQEKCLIQLISKVVVCMQYVLTVTKMLKFSCIAGIEKRDRYYSLIVYTSDLFQIFIFKSR